ncbi:NUDIX hydrolase [Pseudomaricurvus alcaniphilus]|uniref:NUDIX hydrolase n=1 Tax=Pseudomaricurvus alcaniphilus TaxID=1166482 RepID=UPI00140BC981|nr:NUDIX hydrolase [Pseudomaricurvus alcaniphilus]NHN36208.1 NUDIX hydrolase [Pseudomaricurvus alcaniphilus]
MKFCSNCGSKVSLQVPAGDDRERHVCAECETIHYQNPRIIAGCLPTYEDKVLLCKRAIEPRYGLWTLPAGFMENGESTEQGALRESWEEARAEIHLHGLYTLFSLPHINQVYMLFRGELANLNFAPGIESLEVDLFTEDQVPWDQLAFPVMHKTLRYYFADRPRQAFPIRSETIARSKPPIG